MKQPLLAGLLMASSCWAASRRLAVVTGLPEETAAGSTDTSWRYKDDVKVCASLHSCSEVGQSLAVAWNGL